MRRADVTASGLRGAGAIDEVKNATTRCGQQQVSEFLTPATRAASLKQPLSDQAKEEARTLVKGKGREKLTRLFFLRGPMRTNTPKVKKVTPAQATGRKTYSFFFFVDTCAHICQRVSAKRPVLGLHRAAVAARGL